MKPFVKGLASVPIAVALLVGASPAAEAASTSYPDYAYYAQAVPAPTHYRCALGTATVGSAGSIPASVTTKSRQWGLCSEPYPVGTSNMSVGGVILKWTGLSSYYPCAYLTNKTNDFEAFQWMSQTIVNYSQCGSGNYSLTGLHGVYILGTNRTAILSTPKVWL